MHLSRHGQRLPGALRHRRRRRRSSDRAAPSTPRRTGAVETLYAPDRRTPLHPAVLSEDAASLLEGAERPAFVWSIDLDSDGEVTTSDVHRATVRSTAQLDYPSVQRAIDAGSDDEPYVLLREIGERRAAVARASRRRSASNLPGPGGGPGRRRLRAGLPDAAARARTGTRRSRCSPARSPER